MEFTHLLKMYNPQYGGKKESYVVICDFCNGLEKVPLFNDNPAYDGPHEQVCPVCRGKGRRWKIVVTEYELM